MKFLELIKKVIKWQSEDIVENRVKNDESGYAWLAKSIDYDKELKIKDYQDFFDRKELNDQYVSRYEERDIRSKKAYAWHQAEINLIYSFHKCFAMRNHSRLQYYKNDLIQKGARTKSAVNIAAGKLEYYKEKVDQE